MPLPCRTRLVLVAPVLLFPAVSLRAQVQTGVEVLPFDKQWEVLFLVPGPSAGQQNPADFDPDFLETWHTSSYNGPAFLPGTAPFSYGGLLFFQQGGEPRGTFLDVPASGTRGAAYFRTTLDLPGDLTNVQLQFIADDGFILYVDSVRWCSVNMPPGAASRFLDLATAASNEASLSTMALEPIAAGSHVIHMSVHNSSLDSSDLGFVLSMTGDLTIPPPPPAVPALTAALTNPSTDGTPRVLLSATGLDPATAYLIQSSSDLAGWTTTGIFPATADRTRFTIDVPAPLASKYYRLAR